MRLTTKSYKTAKIKNFIKNNHLFFLFNGNSLKSHDWIKTEQVLKKIQLKYYKIFNRTAIKKLDKSIYKKFKTTINGVTFFIKPSSNLKVITKRVLLNNFEPLFFTLIVIKLNNKIYSAQQLKNIRSMNYKTNKLLLYQFKLTHLKFYYNFSK